MHAFGKERSGEVYIDCCRVYRSRILHTPICKIRRDKEGKAGVSRV